MRRHDLGSTLFGDGISTSLSGYPGFPHPEPMFFREVPALWILVPSSFDRLRDLSPLLSIPLVVVLLVATMTTWTVILGVGRVCVVSVGPFLGLTSTPYTDLAGCQPSSSKHTAMIRRVLWIWVHDSLYATRHPISM
jgi:hypothetical protein